MAISRTRSASADDTAGAVKAIDEGNLGVDLVMERVNEEQLAAEKFMSEWVTIVLMPSLDPSEIEVPVSVNGIRVSLKPGVKTKVRRFHVNQLMKARPDIITHRSDDYNAPESQLNRMYRQSTSRYNFDVVEDTPEGIAWLKRMRSRFQRH